MFRQLLFLILVHGVFGKEFKSQIEIKQNSDYVYTKAFHGGVQHITVDDVNILEAEKGSNCVPPNDCWQIVEYDRYLVVNDRLKGTHVAFTVEPKDFPNRSKIVVQYHKMGTYAKLVSSKESRSVFTKKVLENEQIIHVVLFNAGIRDLSIVKDISGTTNLRIFSQFGKTGPYTVKAILFTGHLVTTPRLVKIRFTTGREDHITITPSNKPEATVPMLTFIDYANAFRLK